LFCVVVLFVNLIFDYSLGLIEILLRFISLHRHHHHHHHHHHINETKTSFIIIL
jgi:hypothetical protein